MLIKEFIRVFRCYKVFCIFQMKTCGQFLNFWGETSTQKYKFSLLLRIILDTSWLIVQIPRELVHVAMISCEVADFMKGSFQFIVTR